MANVESPNIPFESQPGNESGLAREMPQPAPAAAAAIADNCRSTADAMAAAKSSLLHPIVDDSDPFALLYSTPANQPLSLARRAYGTESLFQYYALRGYKEVLNEAATPEAAKAVQACLEGGDGAAAGGGVAATVAQHRLSDKKKNAPSLNTHIIDRCLVRTAAAAASDSSAVALATDGAVSSVVPLYVPLRPAQAQDVVSSFRTQRADETRAAAERKRRERLQHVPKAAVYLGRYYPEGSHIVADLRLQLAEEKSEPVANSGAAAKPGAHSPLCTPVALLAPTAPNRGSRALSNPGLGRHSAVKTTESLAAPSIAPLLLRAPQEVAATTQMQQKSRHALADQIENAFVEAYHLRDPAAAQRQHDREAMEAQRRSMQAAAALLAKTGAAAAAKRCVTAGASKKAGGKKKKSKVAPAAPPKREGGMPANLEVFRTSLLLLCNEDGAVTLDQLRALLASVPFHVGTLTATPAASSVGVAERIFHILHKGTRAPSAVDATDLLLAVASVTTAIRGGSLSRQGNVSGDNFICTASHGPGNSFSRTSNAPAGARRGPGANALQVSNASVMSHTTAAAEMGGSMSSEAHTPKTPSLTTGAASSWNEAGGAGGVGKQPLPHSIPADMHDGCKCVLVVEVLDALNALLNSVETKRVVRWECFNVLAVEGNGYIHKSQLAKLRRCAYRDGSAAEEQAAVTAAMVKALSDVFAVVATEEEAAYLKANRKRKKKGGAVALAAHQSSPIPLSVMRTSHMDYAVFCRFFDEMPLMAAAFAHVWMPLLLNGRRHTAAAGGATVRLSDASKFSIASPLPGSAAGATSLLPPSPVSSADPAGERDGEETIGDRFSPSSQLQRRPAPAAEDDPNASPLELLGSTADARQAAVRQLIMDRQEQLHQACDAAEKLSVIQSDEPGSGGTFADS
ncbi:conserved hypothetical protein [Leishmania major strain Friedlin]|uniref:Uncharacterized protein n=1 Tax=Leishmania major TaxID=5664 RepID=Q4QAM1_LEIMA|nr:conserved hypothetical protein [Leishmania major strain Friedlin]CAG9574581.1 hypothetical_protein_-_conserved [Leishmania major strain Friedlin]CAJ04785.1 conserved hypothetical protein [Leishmania major strain Friedlin]|eukprot:XP_001683627.1 conserved hypothetical protein [Leishmania major strain Friedlin]